MEPSPFTRGKLAAAERALLLSLARASIEGGLGRRQAAQAPAIDALPASLRAPRASFVTISCEGELRGCCGVIEAFRPLAADVWHNAWASAFADPRFPALEAAELSLVELEVSVLSDLEPLAVAGQAELIAALEPRRHGLVLALGSRRATFLPKVWESLPEPERFIAELMAKAEIPVRSWSRGLRAWRYTVEALLPAD